MRVMSERVIPLIDERQRKIDSHVPAIPEQLLTPNGLLAKQKIEEKKIIEGKRKNIKWV